MEIAPIFLYPKKNNKKIEQFSNIYLTHCAQGVKIILTIRNNPCKNMGDILERGTKMKAIDDLLKKIVNDFYDEIRHRAILEDDYCPDHNLERKYGVRKCLLEDIRTTILKKYGGGNE